MAREVHKFSVTIPPGTLQTAPLLTDLAMPPRVVTSIEVVVPPGPRGMVGFALAAAGNRIVPYEPGAFFVADDEKISWELSEQISSGAWQLLAYNIGQFSHTLEIRFLVELPGVSTAAALIAGDKLNPPSTVSLPPLEIDLSTLPEPPPLSLPELP